MSQRYERINAGDDEDLDVHGNITSAPVPYDSQPIPSSPPPSFHSRPQSPAAADSNNALSDSFDSPSDDEDGDHDMRNLRNNGQNANFARGETIPLVSTPSSSTDQAARPMTTTSVAQGRGIGGGQTDGVFANLSAKPSAAEKLEEHPPSYEQAAADATPPYWETTILAPGMASDEVFIDGLPVGSVFAFIWNAMISMSFQLVGFLLTYLLHTTHAAKNGSRAGLGITLVQYGFYMKSRPDDTAEGGPPPAETEPTDPNEHNFGAPDIVNENPTNGDTIGRNEWLSYILMVVGWFILIRAVISFLRARRTEQVILASPERGLNIAIVSEDDSPERSV